MFNSVTLLGRLGRDPELKATQNGLDVCTFSLAVNRLKGEETDWFNCVCFAKTASFASQYLRKGQEVLVDGRIQIDKFKDKEGNNRTKTSIICAQVKSVGRSAKEEESNTKPAHTGNDDVQAVSAPRERVWLNPKHQEWAQETDMMMRHGNQKKDDDIPF